MTPRFGLPVELAELADEYEIVEELGRGGSAIVYHARDRALGRDVAIKVVHPRPTSPDDDPVARLAREARMVAQLEHPGIVSVHAVRRLRSGGLTLVMQLVPGATLKTTIQRGGPLDPVRAEEVLRDVADALAYAHARHLVHRDVKPENIFLHAETERALLADFGIARSTEADASTMTGTAIGTPFYMSPEQVDGRALDGRSDLYSLGLVAWEMLTGRRPWDGESLYHVIYKQKHEYLPPIEALRHDVPRRLQYIVERMLQKEPPARWAGAEGLLVQLDRRILPSDYAKWQAALPGRVAQYLATVEAASREAAARIATAKPTRASVIAAATVRFSPAFAQTQRLDAATIAAITGAATPAASGDPSAEIRASTDSVAVAPSATIGGPAADALPTATAASERSDLAESEPLDASAHPAYESVAPTWTEPAPLRPRRRILRYAVPGTVVVAAVIATSAIANSSHARAHLPARPTRAAHVAVSAMRSDAPSPRPSASPMTRVQDPSRPDDAQRTVTRTADAPASSPLDIIAVGAHHACSLTSADAAECWGRNDGAQLGDGSGVSGSHPPRIVAGVMTYTSLGAGAAHTCGVTKYGDVYCWGANEHGQLGDGTGFARVAPVRVGGAGVYRAVHGGNAHSCALDITGAVRCWGDNSVGQLGDGTATSEYFPTLVRLPAGGVAAAVATGARHSCALLTDGRVVCWGSNSDGQLGASDSRVAFEPREVGNVRAAMIAAGDAHTCVVLLDERVECWGRDDAGQLGATRAADGVGVPGRVTVIPGRPSIRAIAAGTSNSCALTQQGALWCWGSSSSGNHRMPIQVGNRAYAGVSGFGLQTCAVTADHAADCWKAAIATAPRPRQRPLRPTVRGVRRRAGAWRSTGR